MTRLTIYGDFNCPFSALASVRADVLLAADAYEIDWRAIQHDTAIPTAGEAVEGDTAAGLADEVATIARPERPRRAPPPRGPTRALEHRRRSAAFAAAGDDADRLRRRLFAAVWAEGRNLGDPAELDRLGAAGRDDVIARRWQDEFEALPQPITPTLVLPDGYVSRGLGALARLAELVAATPSSAPTGRNECNDDFEERIAGVASLAEPQRRALYRFVVTRGDAVSKDEAAAAMGVARSVAAFHLDRLVADGLLTTEFRRLTGRQGPGAGRPAKLYRRAEGELSVSLPARQYDLAAGLLAAAVNEATRTGTPVGEALTRVATERGRELGERAREEAGKRPSRRALLDAALGGARRAGLRTARPRQTRSCSPTARSTPSSTNSATWCAA